MLIKRLMEQWPLGILTAAVLALLPLLNWLAAVIIVLMVLRRGTWVSTLGYILVAVMSYWALSSYSFELLRQDWQGIFAMFLPLWVMAWTLRTTRALNLALELGFVTMVAIILLQLLVQGQPSLQAWIEFFRCRMQTAGISEASLMAATGGTLEQAVRAMMLGWPFAFFLMQISVLFIARWWQAILYYPGGFQIEFHQLRLHKPVALLLAAVLLLLSFTRTEHAVLIQLSTVGLLMLAVPGLALIHWYVKFKEMNLGWLVMVYMLMFLTSFAVLPLLAMIAVLDSGLNFRHRLNRLRKTK